MILSVNLMFYHHRFNLDIKASLGMIVDYETNPF